MSVARRNGLAPASAVRRIRRRTEAPLVNWTRRAGGPPRRRGAWPSSWILAPQVLLTITSRSARRATAKYESIARARRRSSTLGSARPSIWSPPTWGRLPAPSAVADADRAALAFGSLDLASWSPLSAEMALEPRRALRWVDRFADIVDEACPLSRPDSPELRLGHDAATTCSAPMTGSRPAAITIWMVNVFSTPAHGSLTQVPGKGRCRWRAGCAAQRASAPPADQPSASCVIRGQRGALSYRSRWFRQRPWSRPWRSGRGLVTRFFLRGAGGAPVPCPTRGRARISGRVASGWMPAMPAPSLSRAHVSMTARPRAHFIRSRSTSSPPLRSF